MTAISSVSLSAPTPNFSNRCCGCSPQAIVGALCRSWRSNVDCCMLPCARAHPVRAGLPGYQGALRALALEGTPSHGRGRRVRSLVAPPEGEGRRTEWRSAAKRELHGGCDKIGQRAEAENSFNPRPRSRLSSGNRVSCHRTRRSNSWTLQDSRRSTQIRQSLVAVS